MHKIGYMFICIMSITVFLISCQPPENYDLNRIYTKTMNRINEGSYNRQYIKTSELVKDIGEPDLKIHAKYLPKFLSQVNKGKSISDINEMINHNFFKRYLLHKDEDRYIKNADLRWHESEKFKNTELWFYKLFNPSEVKIGGIISRGTGFYAVDYCLIDGEYILFSGTISISDKYEK